MRRAVLVRLGSGVLGRYGRALEHFTALRDTVAGRSPSPALADALAGRSFALRDLGQFPEAAGDARGALAVAREVGYPLGEVLALLDLALAAAAVGEVGEAVRLARQAGQVPGDIPASITRLGDGDTTVLAEYDRHARITGGDPERMMDAAAAAYVALSAIGTDTLLMAANHALRRELSRRIRDDLITLGIVSSGPAVRIADGAQASPVDLMECHDSGGSWRSRRQDDRPHGLCIVEALTGPDSWGVETTDDGNRIVWARLTW